MTKADAQVWTRRWRSVNTFQREELDKMPVEAKARQLAAIMRMALALGWKTATNDEGARIQVLWVKLKRAVRAPTWAAPTAGWDTA